MRAIVRTEYGGPDVLRLAEHERVEPTDDQVGIAVRAASINPLDWHLTTGTPAIMRLQFGLRRPKQPVMGADVAGVVESVGPDVTEFKVGDEVYGEGRAAFSDFAIVRQGGLALKPTNLSFAEAAAYPVAALTALQGLRDWGSMATGHRVLVNGASGGVGTFAVQIAKILGASEIVGVCSGKNAAVVESLGADRVVDYTTEGFSAVGTDFDVYFDAIGSRSLRESLRVVRPGGTFVMVSGPKGKLIRPVPRMIAAKTMGVFVRQRVAGGTARADADDLVTLARWTEEGLVRPVIDRTWTLDQVPQAVAYLAQGRTVGKSVVVVG